MIVCTSAGGAALNHARLTALASRVKPGAVVEVHEIVWRASIAMGSRSPWRSLQDLRDADGLRKAMLYVGLVPAAATSAAEQPLASAAVPLATLVATLYPELATAAKAGKAEAADALAALGATLEPLLAVCVVRGSKPAHAVGASMSLKSRSLLKARTAEAPPPATAPPKPAADVWSALAPSDGTALAPDLLDEDDLLEEEDRAIKKAEEMDCGTSNGGKRKACKNCSCGLREMLENEEANAPPPPAKSACGNCSLGDAFRCAGCPHRGKPAFAPGDELKLADSMLTGDATDAAAQTKILGDALPASGGVVKLSLDDTMDDMDF